MVYLTYIIDNYARLPNITAFLHPHKDGYPRAWHTEQELGYSNVEVLQSLRLDYVRSQGYANLRCTYIPGCPDEIQPFRDPYEEHRDAEHLMPDMWRTFFGPDVAVPQTIGAACCSQFVVTKDQVRTRSLDDYKRYRQWLLDTEVGDDTSGRAFEYIWHVLFGRDPVL